MRERDEAAASPLPLTALPSPNVAGVDIPSTMPPALSDWIAPWCGTDTVAEHTDSVCRGRPRP